MRTAKRVKMIIEYDGSNYHGFQAQNNAITVQEKLVEGINELTKEKANIVCAGRTDAGVHALGQVIAFDTDATIPGERWAIALNNYLPSDINVISSFHVDNDFNPRFHALSKKYTYLILNSSKRTPFWNKYAYCTLGKFEREAIREACQFFVGKHNFRGFCASGSSAKTFERTVHSCKLWEHKDFMGINIVADGFLYNMVRIIVGTLLEIGSKKRSPDVVENLIRSQNRALAGPTAPPQGLYLNKVYYACDLQEEKSTKK